MTQEVPSEADFRNSLGELFRGNARSDHFGFARVFSSRAVAENPQVFHLFHEAGMGSASLCGDRLEEELDGSVEGHGV